MRYLAVGDIHGCHTALVTLAEFVPFQPDDVLITLGDYVDRGPQSRQVLDWLIERREKQRLIPLRGNHEIMMQDARVYGEYALDNWLAVGGREALESYAPPGKKGKLKDVPPAHWDFLERACLPYYETETHVFVHASLYPDLPLADQPDYMLYWESFYTASSHYSEKVMICGHTPQKSGIPANRGFAVCIDTNVCRRGWLTCLDVATGKYWQANQQGETRSAFLDDPEELDW